MGWNRPRENESEKVDVIPVCVVHNRFQRANGKWDDAGFDCESLNNYVVYTKSQSTNINASTCDKCEGELDDMINLYAW